MEITEVRIRLLSKDDSKQRAKASFTIDNCFVIHDVKIIEGKNGLFVSMPNKKLSDGEHKDIVHAINNETRNMVMTTILKAYEDEVAKAQDVA